MTYTTDTLHKEGDRTAIACDFAPRSLNLSINLPLAPEPVSLTAAEPQTASSFGLRATFANWFSRESLMRLRKMAPWLVSGSILGLNLVIHAPTFVIGALITGLTIKVIKSILHSSPVAKKAWQWLLKKANLSEKQIPWMSLGFAGGAWLSASMPSQAAFFVQAETYLRTILTAGNTTGIDTLIPLLFGTLRVIFIIYIGVALVRVINSFRNDEDWVTAARIPLIVVLCVVIGDALSTLIVEGAGGV
jgi:hypothetical protein